MSPNNTRLKIKQIEVIPEAGSRYRVRVTLTSKDQDFVGERSGGGDENERLTTAALATLDAITSALVKPVTLTLKGINGDEVFEELSETLLIVAVIIDDGKTEMVMPGSCRITGDKVEAAIKATLDATNRVTELFL